MFIWSSVGNMRTIPRLGPSGLNSSRPVAAAKLERGKSPQLYQPSWSGSGVAPRGSPTSSISSSGSPEAVLRSVMRPAYRPRSRRATGRSLGPTVLQIAVDCRHQSVMLLLPVALALAGQTNTWDMGGGRTWMNPPGCVVRPERCATDDTIGGLTARDLDWLVPAAHTGNVWAMRAFGLLLWRGALVQRDRQSAVGWFY